MEENRVVSESGAELSARFFAELLDSVESLGGIQEQYADSTLTDLMYLQNAILTGQKVDFWPGETHVDKVLAKLPSADLWLSYHKLGGVWAQACKRVERVVEAG